MVVAVSANTKTGFYNTATSTVEVSGIETRWPYGAWETPPELTHTNPVDDPAYVGDIDQIMVLDKNWVIVSTNTVGQLFDEINTLSGGNLQTNTDLYNASLAAFNPNFTYRQNMYDDRDTYLAEAKTTIEIPLGLAANWAITSPDDTNYSSAQNPSQCDRAYISIGGDTNNGADLTELAPGRSIAGSSGVGVFLANHRVYAYLEMPTALVDGDNYTITYGSSSVTFLFDADFTVSRAIKVNQLGYLPDAGVKKAYLGAYLWGFGQLDLSHATTYQVINADTGAVANSGSLTLVEADPKVNPISATGTTDGTSTGKLIDSTANFTTTATVGQHAWDVNAKLGTPITNIDSDTQLSVETNFFVSGEDYQIVDYKAVGNEDQLNGEDVYEIDFTAMVATGTFYIKVPGVGRSWPFKHEATVYSQLYYSVMRSLYRQRIGTEIPTKYTQWARRKARLGPYYFESENMTFPKHDPDADPSGYNNFNVNGGTTNRNIATAEAMGGYHDAADWDETLIHLVCSADMMYAYQFNTSAFADDQLDIPESGDGIPDILSEAKVGLGLFRLSQDANGGITSWLETWTHPNIASSISGDNPPGATKTDYTFGTRVRWASLAYAAVAAMYARLILPFDAAESADWQQSAIDAYDFGNDSGNSLGTGFIINYTDNRGAGPGTGTYTVNEDDTWIDPYWMWAKLQLWLLTGTDTYITNTPSVSTLEARIQNPYSWQFNRQDFSPWIYYSIIEAFDGGYTGLSSLASTWSTWFTDDADTHISYIADSPYECTWERPSITSMGFGATNMENFNRTMFIADAITARVDSKYYDAAIQNMDFNLGCNPLGYSWTTGIGYVYPVEMQHDTSIRDSLYDPAPGCTLYGWSNRTSSYTVYRTTVTHARKDNQSVSSATQTGGTATFTTAAAHGLSTGHKVRIDNANEADYNLRETITRISDTVFTCPIDSGAPATATGSIIWWQDFVTHSSQWTDFGDDNWPTYRRFYAHPTLLVGQNEFTVHETTASTLFTAACLLDYTAVTETPRDPDYLYGRWPLL